MAYCAKCGKETPHGNFCNECGESLVHENSTANDTQTNSSYSTTSPWHKELLDLGLPLLIISQVENLSHEQQTFFINEYRTKRKSKVLAYILWFFFGLHYLYLGRWGIQFLFWFTGGGFAIWMFIDLFRIPSLVANKNSDIALEVLIFTKHF